MLILGKYRQLSARETEAAWARREISTAAEAIGSKVVWSPWGQAPTHPQTGEEITSPAEQAEVFDGLFVRNFGEIGTRLYPELKRAFHLTVFADFPKDKWEMCQRLFITGMAIPTDRYELSHLDTNPSDFVGKVVRTQRCGRRGDHTYYPKSLAEVGEISRELGGRSKYRGLLVSPYLPNDGDYRAMVIGGWCLGVTKRGPKRPGLKLNRSVGKSKAITCPPQVAAAAQHAATTVGVQFASVDLIVHDGYPKIVEVNEAPTFKIWQRRTKIKVADYLVRYWKMELEQC